MPTLEEWKQLRIEKEFPKEHVCKAGGKRFITPEEWATYTWRYNHTDDFATYEGRDCPHCLSTLMVIKEIHDLTKE